MIMTREQCAGAIGVLVVMGQAFAEPHFAEDEGGLSVLALLSESVTIELTDARLEDVVLFIERESGVAIESIWQDSRHDEGLDPDELVTLEIKNAPFVSLIERVLSKVHGGFDGATWQVSLDGAALEIGPRSRLNASTSIEMYDVRDLLFALPDFASGPQIDLEAALNQGDGGSGGGSIFKDDNGNEADGRLPSEVVQELVDLLQDFVEPDQWRVNGGDGAMVRIIDQTLVIRAPGYVHRAIAGSAGLGR